VCKSKTKIVTRGVTHTEMRNEKLAEYPKGRDHWTDHLKGHWRGHWRGHCRGLTVHRKLILKLIFNRYCVRVWTALNWIRIKPSCEIFITINLLTN
jgi:hypothetical protein